MNPMTTIERELLDHKYKLDGFDEALQRKDADVEDVRRDVRSLKKTVQEDHEAFGKYVARAEAAAELAERAANNSVSAKQLYISFALAVCAILGVLLPFIHH